MNKIVFASNRRNAGKTSIIIGLMKALAKSSSYIKPFGDRLIYRRKKNWDYDSSLILELFDLDEDPKNITLGFDHSKMRYVYDEISIGDALRTMVSNVGYNKDFLFVEGGPDLYHGASLHLDPLSVAQAIDGKLVLVVSGNTDTILDDLKFIRNHINSSSNSFAGVIMNKVHDIEEFEDIYLQNFDDESMPVLGIIPYKKQLTQFSIKYLSEKLYAKVIAGDADMNKVVEHIFVGAMSTDESMRNPVFNKENIFLITSGDRSDMILAALESGTAGILLTNNIMPPANIISQADEKSIPLMIVSADTFHVTKQIDCMQALMTSENEHRLKLLTQLVDKYIDFEKLLA